MQGEVNLDKRQRARLVQACLGLTETEAGNAIAKAVVQANGALDGRAVEAVTAEKQQIIRKSGLLEFYDNSERMDNVGGLDVLKEWLRKRVRAFGDEARAFGLPEPKGILLVGVQGCGKSLVARSVANAWRLPLLRLDVGRLFASLVGSSEENLRQAIRVAESISPVVLWVDEIEKGFSGVGSSNVSDAGTAARVFGSFITWLQEKQKPVFVIATANDVSQLPPELVRKGRFDEIFFVDLPSAQERVDIWRIHLLKRNRDPGQFDLGVLAMASEGLSGAEIEQAVIAGLYEAFDRGRPLEMSRPARRPPGHRPPQPHDGRPDRRPARLGPPAGAAGQHQLNARNRVSSRNSVPCTVSIPPVHASPLIMRITVQMCYTDSR